MATPNRFRVLLPKTMVKAGWDIVKGRDDVEAIAYPTNVQPPEFHPLLRDVDGIALSLTPFGAPELGAAPRIKVVARVGVGFDTVDVPVLTAQKVPLMIAGTANSPSVAEQAFSLLFALAKRNAENDAAVRTGTWREPLKAYPIDFIDKTLVIVGFGRIGTRVAKRALAFEMRVLAYDPYVPARTIEAAGCTPVTDLDKAVTEADFITIHCPKNAETTNLFDAARLGRMKRSAYIVNTARGGIINERALCDALDAGKLAGAGIDVFDREPAPGDHPLLKAPNVIVAPHLAGVTVESLDRMAVTTVENILSVLNGKPTKDNAVNPEVFG